MGLTAALLATAGPSTGAADAAADDAHAPRSAADIIARAPRLLADGHVQLLLDAFDAQPPAAGDARQLATLAAALAAADRHAEAADTYQAAITAGHEEALELHEAIARARWMLGDTEAARQRWRSVLERLPGAEQATARRTTAAARAARALGRGDPALLRSALDLYEQAIGLDPDHVPARIELGDLLLDKYNSAEAGEVYTEVLGRDDGPHVEALIGLARTQHFDHSSAAEQTIAAALELRPGHVPALRLAARLRLEMEEYAAAQTLIEQALGFNPADRQTLALKAALAFLRGEESSFESLLDTLRERAPGDASVFVTLAEIAAQNRRYQSAVRLAAMAVDTDAEEWRGHVLLGINRMRRGDIDAGRRSLERAFRGDPFNVWSKNTLELLDKLAGFTSIASRNFVLVAPRNEAPVLAPYLLPLAEQAFAYYSNRHDHQPDTPIRIELYARHEDFSVRTAGLVGLDIMGVSFGPVIALDSPSAGAFGPTNWGSVIWHELAHSFHLSKSRFRAPRWFSEGLAVHEERRARPGWGADVTPGFLNAYRDGKLPRPSELNRVFLRPSYPEQMIHGYFFGALLMEYIEAEHGFAAIDGMLAGFGRGERLEALVSELMGIDLATLDERFDAHLRERFADALAALQPAAEGQPPPYVAALKEGHEALEAGELERAEEALRRANELLPWHAGKGSSYHLLAELHERRGEPREAVYWLRRNIDIDADDLQAHRRLVTLLEGLGDDQQTEAMIERTLYISPFQTDLHERLAEIYEARGDWRDAVRAREAVVTLDRSDPVVAGQHLARALLEAGDAEGARGTLLRVLEQAPMYEAGLELLLDLRARTAQGG